MLCTKYTRECDKIRHGGGEIKGGLSSLLGLLMLVDLRGLWTHSLMDACNVDK